MISFYNSKEDEESGKAPVGSLELGMLNSICELPSHLTESAVLQKAKEEKAFQLTTPKKDLTLFTSTDAELSLWMEGLNAIIAALKRRQAGLLEQHRDRQRLVELESRFEELLVLDLSDNAESALSAYSESRGSGSGSGSNLKERDVVQGSALLSPRPVTPVSPRGLRPPVRPLALSNQSLDTDDDLSVIPSLQSPHSGSAAPPPRLYLNWMFAHNRAVSWFAKLVYGCPVLHMQRSDRAPIAVSSR